MQLQHLIERGGGQKAAAARLSTRQHALGQQGQIPCRRVHAAIRVVGVSKLRIGFETAVAAGRAEDLADEEVAFRLFRAGAETGEGKALLHVVSGRQLARAIVRQKPGRVRHAERLEHVRPGERGQGRAPDGLGYGAGDTGAQIAVLAFGSGRCLEVVGAAFIACAFWRQEAAKVIDQRRRRVRPLLVVRDNVEVCDAGCMGRQLANGYRLAIGIGIVHPEGQHGVDVSVQIQQALVVKLQQDDPQYRLADGGDVHGRVGGHRPTRFHVGEAVALHVDDLVISHDGDGHAWNRLFLHQRWNEFSKGLRAFGAHHLFW